MDNEIIKNFINAHRKVLVDEITQVVEDLLHGPAFQILNDHYRQIVLDLLHEHMDNYQHQNIIRSYKIIGDWRNNSPVDILSGKYSIEVQFRHKESLVTTTLKYTTNKPIDDFII